VGEEDDLVAGLIAAHDDLVGSSRPSISAATASKTAVGGWEPSAL
jgi:hypothetical protein